MPEAAENQKPILPPEVDEAFLRLEEALSEIVPNAVGALVQASVTSTANLYRPLLDAAKAVLALIEKGELIPLEEDDPAVTKACADLAAAVKAIEG